MPHVSLFLTAYKVLMIPSYILLTCYAILPPTAYQEAKPALKIVTLCGMMECKAAVKDRKKALKRVKSFPTANDLANYRIIRAKARRTMKTSKRQSWRSIVSKINSRTSIKKDWSMVHKIAGKNQILKFISYTQMVMR